MFEYLRKFKKILISSLTLMMAFVLLLSAIELGWVNLINNSIEPSGNGQSVAVSVIPGKNSLRIAIKDNGAGMDSGTAENIFTPFYTRKSGGTGLGMSIAKKIIDSHHGKINVSSKTCKGTAVTIELPYKLAAKRGFGS